MVARQFGDLADTDAVYLFGSWAARYLGQQGRAPNDIDVLVIGSPNHDQVDDAAERAQREVGFSRSGDDLAGTEPFIAEVKSRPLVAVLVSGGEADLAGAFETERRQAGDAL